MYAGSQIDAKKKKIVHVALEGYGGAIVIYQVQKGLRDLVFWFKITHPILAASACPVQY